MVCPINKQAKPKIPRSPNGVPFKNSHTNRTKKKEKRHENLQQSMANWKGTMRQCKCEGSAMKGGERG